MIKIDLRKALKNSGEVFHYEYEGMPELQDIVFSSPLALKAKYSSTKEGVHIYGDFDTVVQVECARCLDRVDYHVSVAFDEMFTAVAQEDGFTYSGETLDLNKLLYDEIVLHIPQQVLCKEDCKGICQVCGMNLNESECDCEQLYEDDSNPFSKLKGIF